MTTTPEGLVPGPDGTFYGELRHVPDDMEIRAAAENGWREARRGRLSWLPTCIVQARPAPLGPPSGLKFGDARVTIWGEMRDRPDLAQWEYARPAVYDSEWLPCGRLCPGTTPDDFPLVVRRKASDR